MELSSIQMGTNMKDSSRKTKWAAQVLLSSEVVDSTKALGRITGPMAKERWSMQIVSSYQKDASSKESSETL